MQSGNAIRIQLNKWQNCDQYDIKFLVNLQRLNIKNGVDLLQIMMFCKIEWMHAFFECMRFLRLKRNAILVEAY